MRDTSHSSSSPLVAGIGEILWDVFPEGEAFGGAPANFACHCSNLGAHATVISAVGQDIRGQDAIKALTDHHVSSNCISTVDQETGFVNVTLDAKGSPEYTIQESVAWDFIPLSDSMIDLAPKLDAICFGTLGQRSPKSRETIQAFLKATRKDCLRVFDINIRLNYYSEEIILESLALANVIKLNDEELPLLAAMIGAEGSQEKQLKTVLEHFDLKLAVLTCGSEGAYMATSSQLSHARAPALDSVVSAVGAGDSFTATTIMGFLKGLDLDVINQHANRVAAFICTQQGAVADLPPELIQPST